MHTRPKSGAGDTRQKRDGQRADWVVPRQTCASEQALTALCASLSCRSERESTALKHCALSASESRAKHDVVDAAAAARSRSQPSGAPRATTPRRSASATSPCRRRRLSRRQSQAGRGHKQERTRHRRRTTLQRSAPTLARQRFGGVRALPQKDVQFVARRARGPPQRRGPMLSPRYDVCS
jgi:hypothetical protein